MGFIFYQMTPGIACFTDCHTPKKMQLSDVASETNQYAENQSVEDLIKIARNTSAVAVTLNNEPPPINLPSWVDPKAIQAGREFVRRHFFLIFFTHFISLILLLSYIPVRTVLVKTKRSHTKDLALARYLSTLRHVQLWYEDDLSCADSIATKDVIKIRHIHSGVYKRLKDNPPPEDLHLLKSNKSKAQFNDNKSTSILAALNKCTKLVDENNNSVCKNREASPHIISQLDLIVTQYCFMGLLTSFPEKFGISSSSIQDMEGLKGFIHIWAVIGHHLGIEERSNICIGERSSLRKYILHEILLPDFLASTTETFVLWEALVSAMSVFIPCLSLRAGLLFILEYIFEVNQDISDLYFGATLYDIFCYKLAGIFINICINVSIIMNTFSSLLRLAVYLTNVRLDLKRKLGNYFP